MQAELFDALMAHREQKTPIAIVTRLEDGAQALVTRTGTERAAPSLRRSDRRSTHPYAGRP